ncbi:hypothetical protein EGT51_02825 [Levilactobacillus suantsaiihabitans]|uniref:DUF1129 family protein n=1 Tax=Levilactobacillus suantsaiihabitans TaxID=2487722 RepID=A0A4Z0JBI0_9LACO|nr:hypothetical protein EGT51_02825 [Levilactobacillus suantsaiihabitans]
MRGVANLANRLTIAEQNQELRSQLSPENQAYWDELVAALKQHPRFADDGKLQRFLREQLPQVLVAQSNGQTTAQFYGMDAQAAAVKLGSARQRPTWWSWDLLVPVLIFVLGVILPAAILPAVPLQGLLIAVQFGLFVIAMALGIWVSQHLGAQGQVLSWLVIIVALVVAMRVAAQTVPAAGLLYLTRGGGSVALIAFAVIVTGLTWWHHQRHADSWFPAILGSLWITTLLALLARFPLTSGLMVTSAGNLLIAIGTVLADASILMIGWHIWQIRQGKK